MTPAARPSSPTPAFARGGEARPLQAKSASPQTAPGITPRALDDIVMCFGMAH